MPKPRLILRNVGLAVACLLLWAAARFLLLLFHRQPQLLRLDVFFIVAPPLAAFFLNWRWLRDQHPDLLVRGVVSWVAIDLLVFTLCVLLLAAPLTSAFTLVQQ